MLSKSHLESLEALFPPLGHEGVVNLALVLCGARPAFMVSSFNLDPATRKIAKKAAGDEDAYDRILEEHGHRLGDAIVTAFKKLKVIYRAQPIIYDPAKTDKKDLAVVGVEPKTKAQITKYVRAMGRLLGYVGTALPTPKDGKYVTMHVMCVDSKNRAHSLFAQAVFPSEVYDALAQFNDFLATAKPLIGQRLAKGLVAKEFVVRFHQFPLIELNPMDDSRKRHYYIRS